MTVESVYLLLLAVVLLSSSSRSSDATNPAMFSVFSVADVINFSF